MRRLFFSLGLVLLPAALPAQTAADSPIPPDEQIRKILADRIDRELSADPVLRNATNSEPPLQSGVTVAAGGGIAIGLGTLLIQWGEGRLSAETLDPALLGMMALSAWGLWRRWAPGLRPLGEGWLARLIGFGRRQ